MSKINLVRPYFDDDDREYFQCDCHSHDHTIYAVHDKIFDQDKTESIYEDIYLMFVVRRGDYEAGYSKYRTVNFFRRWRWRIRMASSIIFRGELEYEDAWIPERRAGEQVRGKQELRKLINWMAQKDLELESREMEARKLSVEELAARKEFADKWSWHPIDDKTA